MKESEYKLHFGVYGVAISRDKLLCISKNSGPYKNRYDLPGGSQERGEGLTDTLVREVFEETGYSISDYREPRIYDTFIKPADSYLITHHVFALYTVTLNDRPESIPEEVIDGKNDSDGIHWLSFAELDETNASPLILKVIDEWNNTSNILDKSVFGDWKIKHN